MGSKDKGGRETRKPKKDAKAKAAKTALRTLPAAPPPPEEKPPA